MLSESDRFAVWAEAMRDWSTMPDLLKADLRAAVDAADDWVDSSQSSYNAALPQPFKGSATTAQKTLLLAFVLMRRIGRLITREDL